MTIVLGYEVISGVLHMRDAIDLLENSLRHESIGRTAVSHKFVTEFEGGSLRFLFAADYQSGHFATKAYHLVDGVGARYVVSLYSLATGELLALIDGRIITDLRTGAASGVIARKVSMPGPVRVGLIGSGHQARAQLESLATVFQVESCAVYSPTAANRVAFAREMEAKLGFPVVPMENVEAAVRSRDVVATASSARSNEPILRGEWLDGCRLLCAVGNTRPQFAEADVRCFSDARIVVVDSLHAVNEAGDLLHAKASGALPESKWATLAQISSGIVPLPSEGLITFKSVGTALQDLALAIRYYELLYQREDLPTVSDLASLS
jgi:ornithine cyclodeaminase/alanine dehydrogenase-like protein (mu-crystallin family)